MVCSQNWVISLEKDYTFAPHYNLRGGSIADSQLQEIPASDVLARIVNGDPVIYDHIAVAGDLDLSNLDLPVMRIQHTEGEDRVAKIIVSKVQIRSCEIHGSVNFAGALFKESVDLEGSIFCCEARFKGAVFQGKAIFEAAQFGRYATFKDAWFGKESTFIGAQFGGIANFGSAHFSDDASFVSAKFSDLCTNFSFVHFERDTDFTGAQFSGTANFRNAAFGGTASFWQSSFGADATFERAIFSGYVSFLNARFGGNADFRQSDFEGDLNFELSEFSGNSIFFGSIFQGKANFFSSTFNGDTNFEGVKMEDAGFAQARFGQAVFCDACFRGDAKFERSLFAESANFSRSLFGGTASFSSAAFSGTASFIDVEFCGLSQFSAVRFRGDAVFDQAKFDDDASFNSTYFEGKALFKAALFSEDARFMGSRFMDAADLSGSEFRKNLILESARIYTMRLLNAIFTAGSHVYLHRSDFSELEVQWASIKNRLIYDGAVYLSLIKNFKNMEWFEDADDCYYQYRRKSQAEKKLITWQRGMPEINWSKLLDALAWISCGYGVRPKYTIFLSILLIFFFAGLFWTGDSIMVEHINSTAAGEHLAQDDQIHSLSFADHLYFSAMIFTAKTLVKWYPAGVYRYLATAETILGWLLMALFLVTLGRTMIR